MIDFDSKWEIGDLGQCKVSSLFEGLEDALLVVNAELKIIHCNTAAIHILREQPEHLHLRSIVEVLQIEAESSQQKPQMDWSAHRSMSLPRHAYIRAGEEKVYLSMTVSPILEMGEFRGYLVVLRDVSRFVHSEQLIERQKQELDYLLDVMPIGVAVVDAWLNLHKVNQAFKDAFNLSEALRVQAFGDVIACVNSQQSGCGNSLACSFCAFRKRFKEHLSSGQPLKNQLIEINYYKQGANVQQWFEVSVQPLRESTVLQELHLITLKDVTDRIISDQAVKSAQEVTLQLLNSLPLMMFRVNVTGICDYLSQYLQSTLGLHLEGFMEQLSSMLSPEERQALCSKISDSIQGEIAFTHEVNLWVKGDSRPVTVLGKPYWNYRSEFQGFMCLLFDNFEMNQLKGLFEHSQSRYTSLLENLETSIGFVRLERDAATGRISQLIVTEMNHAAETNMPFQAQDMTRPQLVWKYPEDFGHVSELVTLLDSLVMTGMPISGKDIFNASTKKWYNVSMYLSDADTVAVLADEITKKKYAEIELMRAMKASQDANRSKSEFLANMSHEIRTPLNGIVGMIELTLLDPLSQEQRENLNIAKKCVGTLIDIINDILDFAKLEAGKLALEQGEFSLNNLIETVERIHRPLLQQKNIQWHVDNRCTPMDTFVSDEKRLLQIVNNIVGNAVKFTVQGSVGISVSYTDSSAQQNEGVLRIACRDTGIGIAVNDYDKLFKTFSQIDGSYTRQYGGTGLGLVISRQLVQLLEGNITFASELGVGSEFVIEIPVRLAESRQERHVIEPTYDIQHKSILLVEDDVVNQLVIGKTLESAGLIVDYAADGIKGVAMASEKQYDLIIMDIQMPRLDGIQATQRIREVQTSKNRRTVIVALTAFAQKADEALFRASGMDDYLSKPVDRQTLLSLLQRHLSRERIVHEGQGNTMEAQLESFIAEGTQSPSNSVDIERINTLIQHLEKSIQASNLISMELFSHQLKDQFSLISSEELRTLAFKIELSARKNRIDQAEMHFSSLKHMCALLLEHQQKIEG